VGLHLVVWPAVAILYLEPSNFAAPEMLVSSMLGDNAIVGLHLTGEVMLNFGAEVTIIF